MHKPMDVSVEFPVRKSKKQKAAFRESVMNYGAGLGYECRVERGSFGVWNVVMGNSETAKYLITAHYDTCAGLPFPNLITPCSLPLFVAWQLLMLLILAVPAGVVGGLVAAGLGDRSLVPLCCYLVLWIELILMLFGPANRSNANDNTSGVVTVLETAASLPAELRDNVCFVLFDLEEGGLLGSAAYRKLHRKASGSQIVLNVDCVGEGDDILLFPTGKLKKKNDLMDLLEPDGLNRDGKTICLKKTGFSVYPSDQGNFPLGVGIAAFCRSPWAGLYLAKIHTKRDTILDEKNVALVRDYLLQVLRSWA